MSLGAVLATILQTLFIFVFIFILTPFRMPLKKALQIFVGVTAAFCTIAGVLSHFYGVVFLYRYGFLFVSIPIFVVVSFLSSVKGFRFLFVAFTAVLFHQIIFTLMMVFRVYNGGYTFWYFVLNMLAFGALMLGGYVMRSDFHQIVLTYRYEFCCLCPILLLLFGMLRVFAPVVEPNVVDPELFIITLFLDLLIVLLYLYITVSFHSLSKSLDAERTTLSLQHQIEEAQNHVTLMQGFQQRTVLHQHDMRHHFALISELLEHEKYDELRAYLEEVQHDAARAAPAQYCQNETLNLLISSFASRAQKVGVLLYADTRLPHSLPIGNNELCALLSNALENAITAASRLEDDRQKNVRLAADISGGKLLVLVENPYSGTVQLDKGLPLPTPPGHGIGTKSIVAITEKYGGLYFFEAKDGVFTLRIAI